MTNIIIPFLILYIFYITICPSLESFTNLYKKYKYPYCRNCEKKNNVISCKDCITFDAINGIKQPSDSYYKSIKTTKRKCIKYCDEDNKCRVADYNTKSNICNLSNVNLQPDCLLYQSSDKYIHYTKTNETPQNKSQVQQIVKPITEQSRAINEECTVINEEPKPFNKESDIITKQIKAQQSINFKNQQLTDNLIKTLTKQLDKPVNQLVNQPTNQPTNQQFNKLINILEPKQELMPKKQDPIYTEPIVKCPKCPDVKLECPAIPPQRQIAKIVRRKVCRPKIKK